jgi:hypothetical protein
MTAYQNHSEARGKRLVWLYLLRRRLIMELKIVQFGLENGLDNL